MSVHSPPAVVKKTEPLSEEFLPQKMVGRETQLRDLLRQLVPSKGREHPLHAWLYGPPGSGKTAVARTVLPQLEEQHVRNAYVNCWNAQRFYAVLETIFREVREVVGEIRDRVFTGC